MPRDHEAVPHPGRRRFPTTRWSWILAAAGPPTPSAEAALASLCETYWLPVYAFVRWTGASTEDARDLTQAFFARVLEKGVLSHARQDRGRFRSFLRAAVRNFLSNQREFDQARKRGGAQPPLSLEFELDGERLVQFEPRDNRTPEDVFEEQWAWLVVDRALGRLAAKYERSGHGQTFAVLKPFLSGQNLQSPAAAAEALGLSAGAFRVALSRCRTHLRTCLRDVVLDTVENPEEVDDELEYLLRILSR